MVVRSGENKLNEKTEFDLAIEKAISGDAAAFRWIYQQKAKFVQFIGRKLGLSIPETDDLVQEVFVKLHQNMNKIENEKSLNGWLATVARNIVIDDMRRRKRRKTESVGERVEVLESSSQEIELQEEAIQREIEIKLVGDLLEELSDTSAGQSFKEFYKDGMTVKEIAEKNGESVGTVTSRISRFRTKFKEAMKKKISESR